MTVMMMAKSEVGKDGCLLLLAALSLLASFIIRALCSVRVRARQNGAHLYASSELD